jgi:hypothetical protein
MAEYGAHVNEHAKSLPMALKRREATGSTFR